MAIVYGTTKFMIIMILSSAAVITVTLAMAYIRVIPVISSPSSVPVVAVIFMANVLVNLIVDVEHCRVRRR